MEIPNIFRFSIKKFGLGLAIVIVFNLFINYGIHTFYKEPDYNNFCSPEKLNEVQNKINEAQDAAAKKSVCEYNGGLWTVNSQYYPEKPMPSPIDRTQVQEPGWCDTSYSCRKDFDAINNVYRRNVFVVWIVSGLVAIGISFFAVTVQMLSTSFLFAGLLSLLIGTMQYWSAMQDYLRFIILGIALVFLIFVAYKKLKDKNEPQA